MKFYQPIGLLICIVLVASCFMPWCYYADLNKVFTGFFSEHNAYGKPGKFITGVAVISIALILTQKVWAKRTHIFLAALNGGYAIKTFVLYTSCYNAYCPEKRAGIWIMLIGSFLLLFISIFPDMKIGNTNIQSNSNPTEIKT